MDPSQISLFLREGYYILRGGLNSSQVDRYRILARNIQNKTQKRHYPGTRFWAGGKRAEGYKEIRPEIRPERSLHDLAFNTWGVDELTRKEFFEPELVNVFGHPKVDAAMQALLGSEPRAWGIKLLWNPKNHPYNLQWHKDQMTPDLYDWVRFKPEEQDHVQFNAALNHDGCFLLLPGSHRRALSEREWEVVLARGTGHLPGELRVVLEPGDILFMDAHVLHRGECGLDADRLTLHYSAQAQWVPLKPWGDGDNLDWMASDEFMGKLGPRTRPYYERLRTASLCSDAMEFVKKAAKPHGWRENGPAPA